MKSLDEIKTFIRANLGEYLIDNSLLDWYLSRLYEKNQIIVVKDNDEIKAIQGYFLCTDEDLPYIETGEWCLPLNFINGDVLYLALTVSKESKYLKKIGEEVRNIMHNKHIAKIIIYELPEKKVKIWTKVFGKWLYNQGGLECLKNNLAVAHAR